MNFANEYKLIYVKGTGADRKLYASKKAIPTEDDAVLDPNLEALEGVKLIYVKNGKFYASKKEVPTDEDVEVEITCDGEAVLVDPTVDSTDDGNTDDTDKDPGEKDPTDPEEPEEPDEPGEEEEPETPGVEKITDVDMLDPKNYSPGNTNGSGLTLAEDGSFVVNKEGAWLNREADFENYNYSLEFKLISNVEDSNSSIQFDAGIIDNWDAPTGPVVRNDQAEHYIAIKYELDDDTLTIRGYVDDNPKTSDRTIAKDKLGEHPNLYWDIYTVNGADVFSIKDMVVRAIEK